MEFYYMNRKIDEFQHNSSRTRVLNKTKQKHNLKLEFYYYYIKKA